MPSKVIAIDGPAYVGKSQIAKELSAITGFSYINTGHMFRAFAKLAKDNNISLDDEQTISNMPFDIEFHKGETHVKTIAFPSPLPEVGGAWDWTDKLDDVEIVKAASRIAVYPKVRERLAAMQRGYAQKGFIIMEGRDIGTTVFPDALCRVYVTATSEVRARRLYKMLPEMERAKNPLTEKLLRQLLTEKLTPIDELDANRKISPLISEAVARKSGYFIHDNSNIATAREDAEIIYRDYVKAKLDQEKIKIGTHC